MRTAAKEAVEFFAGQAERQGAKAMAKELAEVGGETAVRNVFEQVARESGEAGVQTLVKLSKSYGVDAIRAAQVAPRLALLAERVSPELAPSALRALLRPEERAVLERLGSELTPAALEAAARHPGVGVEVVERLGAAGVQASKRYDTDAVIQLVKSSEAKSFTALPASEKTGLLKRVAQFIEQHPKTVLGAAGLALFVRYKDELLGDKGEIITGPDGTPIYVPKTGILERSSNRILEWLLPIAAAIVALWGAQPPLLGVAVVEGVVRGESGWIGDATRLT